MKKIKIIAFCLTLTLAFNVSARVEAQTDTRGETFGKIQMLQSKGEKVEEIDVQISFGETAAQIKARKNGAILKELRYAEIKSAEYSYTKNPRWKTGLALGASSIIFPPMLLVALPLGFTKHRRHWLTVRTENDYAVLKLSKSVRKTFIPAFETRSGVEVEAQGDNK